MSLTKYKLGELIEQTILKNSNLEFGEKSVVGISTQKTIISTKANLDGVSLSSYKILLPNHFAYVSDTSRRGDKISLCFNNSNASYLISQISTVFKVKEIGILNSSYLFMYFNRPEFDRFSRFNSWGSARETFSYEDLCDVEIELPDIKIQQKYVDIYNSMLANQQNCEKGLDDLKLVCESAIDKYKKTATKKIIGEILQEIDIRNTSNTFDNVKGINIDKKFMPSIANTNDIDLSKYKIVEKGQFAFSGMQTGRDECIRIAFYDSGIPIIISPAYTVFKLKDNTVSPEYIMLWFSRKEIDRLGCFMSDGSIRANLDLDRLYEFRIPIPDIEVQKAIVDIYKCYKKQKEISQKLKEQIKNICPILIKGAIEEGKR